MYELLDGMGPRLIETGDHFDQYLLSNRQILNNWTLMRFNNLFGRNTFVMSINIHNVLLEHLKPNCLDVNSFSFRLYCTY